MKAKEFIIESIKSFILEGTTVDEKPYKGYTVRIVDNRPKTKGFVGIAFKEKKGKVVDTFLVKVPKATPAEVEKELSDYVDSKVSLSNNSLTQFKSGQITMFFNTILSKEIFGPDAVLYADVENVNGKPVLIISTDDQGGMHKVYDRNINKESGRGTGIFLMPRKNAINAGLTLSRYDLGREIDYGVPEVEAFELKWNSDVIPGEPLKLGGPGLTVSPPRKGQEMDESLLMNEVEDILQEAKKTVLQMPKPRDPNWQTMQAKAASGAGGKHIDKKRAEKQGNVKHKNKFNYKQDNWSSDFERRMKNEDQFELVKKLQWPEVVNKVNSAMKAMGWKGQRKDDGSFMFSTRGQLPEESDEWYIVIIDNRGNNMFTYALGTVEEGDPHIGEQETLPNTEASVSELMDAVREGFGLGESQGVAEGYDSEELANEVYAEFERMYPNLARRANERTVHAAIMDVLNYGGDSDPAALAQDVARAVKRNMQGVSEGENFRDKKSLEQRLYNYEAAVNRAREATRVIKNADMHMEIISEILELAKKTGIEETEFKDQIDDIYEAVSNLQSEVYKLEEPFTDAVRLVQNTLDELEIDEWERNRSKDNE